MLDDDWIHTGDHRFVDCWCGHTESSTPGGKTLDARFERVHQWITRACPDACELQSRMHGHVHVHCPRCNDCC